MSKDDNAVNDEVVTDATTTDSAPVETNESEVTVDNALSDDAFDDIDDELRDETDSEGDSKESEATEETSTDQPEVETSPEDEFNKMAGTSQEKWRQTINERNELRRQMQELEARNAQFATEQELVNEINPETGEEYTPQEIERISWLQQREALAERNNNELYELQVQQNQQAIDAEVGQVKEISMFNPESKDFNQTQFNRYMDALSDNLVYQMPDGQQYNRSTLVANGINPEQQATLVGVHTSPLKLAKLIADPYNEARQQGEVVGQANAQKATDKMLANADSPAGATSSTSKDDTSDFDEGWID